MPRRTIEFLLYLGGPAVAIVTTPFLARGLGPDARGELGLILTVVGIATMLGNFGQAEVIVGDAKSSGPSRSSVRVAIGGGILTAVVAAVALGLSGAALDATLIACAAIPFIVASGLWYGLAIAARDTTRPAFASGVAALWRLALIPLLALAALLTLANAIAVLQFAIVIGAVVALLPYARSAARLPHGPSSRSVRSALRAGAPVVVFGLITAVTLRADLFAVALQGDPTALGTYAAVVALGQAGLAVSAHFKARVQAAVQSESDVLRRVVREWAPLVGLCAAGILGAAVLAQPIADVFFGPEYPGAADLLRFVALSASVQLMLDVVHGLLTVLGMRRQLVVTASIGAATTVLLLALLVPALGPIGAALATAAAAAAASLVGGAFSFRALRALRVRERAGVDA